MKSILRIASVLGIYTLLVSAMCIERPVTSLVNKQNIIIPNYPNSKFLKTHKLNFFQRLMVKILAKKNKLVKSANADKLASTSLLLGIGACAFLVLGLFIPYVILATLPAGIAAMITGGSAIRNRTTLVGKAKTGKGLGLGALIAFGVVFIVVAIAVASLLSGI